MYEMQLPYSDTLKVEFLSHIFDKKSESYKLFWFQAIVNKVLEGKNELSYDELINEMIADSWYMVTEYKLNLGPSDNLEGLVHYIFEISGLKTNEKKENILKFLLWCEDKKVAKMKRDLTYHVPYRLQSSFMENIKGSDEWKVSEKKLIDKINREKRLMYYFSELSGMQTEIYIRPEWCNYIVKNQDILKGWIQYHLIIYLQRRNPNVPGISSKLNPPVSRKLSRVTKYWKMIINLTPIHDIYGDQLLTEEDLSIDHFIPWSYVAHDELWNLHPTTVRMNSKKSNNLPAWNRYFPALCETEFNAYQMIWKYEAVYDEFERCKKEHVNSNDAMMKLYRPNISADEYRTNLEHILLPVYDAAKNAGFTTWKIGDVGDNETIAIAEKH